MDLNYPYGKSKSAINSTHKIRILLSTMHDTRFEISVNFKINITMIIIFFTIHYIWLDCTDTCSPRDFLIKDNQRFFLVLSTL